MIDVITTKSLTFWYKFTYVSRVEHDVSLNWTFSSNPRSGVEQTDLPFLCRARVMEQSPLISEDSGFEIITDVWTLFNLFDSAWIVQNKRGKKAYDDLVFLSNEKTSFVTVAFCLSITNLIIFHEKSF